jgi:hypothetical protein
MIHYTLLPEKDAKGLKLEYRIRVFIVLLFFVSCAVIAGIISLTPAYMISSIQEKELNDKLLAVQKSKVARGVDVSIEELNKSSEILKILKETDRATHISSTIQEIASLKLPSSTFNSIQINHVPEDKSDYEIIIQGRSSTRESLLELKKSLEINPIFSKVEFPIPDLTKSKDVTFAVKLKLNKIK